jgi:hypothetical protein
MNTERALIRRREGREGKGINETKNDEVQCLFRTYGRTCSIWTVL